MQHLSTAFLIIALVIAVKQGQAVAAGSEPHNDQVAEETKYDKNSALKITDGPKYVKKQSTARNITIESRPTTEAHKPEQRPPSKPPINPDKVPQKPPKYYFEIPRTHFNSVQKVPFAARQHFAQPPLLYHPPNSIYNNFQQVIPLASNKNTFNVKQQSRPLVFASSTNKATVTNSPKFSLPVQTITGVRTDNVRPPPVSLKTSVSTTTTPTTTSLTTTTRLLRTKRIWPKRILEKMNATVQNSTKTNDTQILDNTISDTDTAETIHRVKYVYKNINTTEEPKKREYRPVTRLPKIRSTTPSPFNVSEIEPNDWIPLVPVHFTRNGRPTLKRITKRSVRSVYPSQSELYSEPTVPNKNVLFLQSFGLIPVKPTASTTTTHLQTPAPEISRKKSFFRKRKRQQNLNPYYSGYDPNPGIGTTLHYYYDHTPSGTHIYSDNNHQHNHPPNFYDHIMSGSHVHSHGYSHNNHQHSHRPKVVTKVKHHHHHHHHRYIKTVEKPVKVPFKVEVPKPYPVTVEKKVPYPVEKIKVVEKPVPYPVTVEKKVPFPFGIKVPHPVPVKVVEKEYVPKPYPVIQQVPVIRHVEVKVPQPVPVPVQVETRVPYPVEVQVPVDRPVPVPVTVEKQVPYPVPVKVLVPQPYPVETKVPYPVQVKVREPVEVIKHVPVQVPVPQPFAVRVPHPVPVEVEKKVPYPVEVEKKVPVPFKVLVPQKVEVEKRVPVYIPKPYPVEKKIPVPVKVPYPVKVPVKVPYRVPVEVPVPVYGDGYYVSGGLTVSDESVTEVTPHSVTVHGNTGFTGFQAAQSRSDAPETATTTDATRSSTSSP